MEKIKRYQPPQTYKVILEKLDDLSEGYYVGHIGINQYIYGRGTKARALEFTKNEAIRFIDDARAAGYPCRAEPRFSVTTEY